MKLTKGITTVQTLLSLLDIVIVLFLIAVRAGGVGGGMF